MRHGDRWVTLGRVRRDALTGSVSVDLIRDDDTVELSDGGEFITLETPVDPFVPADGAG